MKYKNNLKNELWESPTTSMIFFRIKKSDLRAASFCAKIVPKKKKNNTDIFSESSYSWENDYLINFHQLSSEKYIKEFNSAIELNNYF